MTYIINNEACVGCGVCVDRCSQNAIEQVDDKYQIIKDKCTDCGSCVEACPANAISKGE